jgi:DNA repair photolyase
MVRGDGHVGRYRHERPGRAKDDHYGFRLALIDRPALDRAREYLGLAGLTTTEFAFQAATATRAGMTAIRTSAQSQVETIEQLVRWPVSPDDDWRKGFLAGIFDAEGSCGAQALRISNRDPLIVSWTEACLRQFGFECVLEPPNAAGVRCVRLRGGLAEKLRFFHLTGPAITRKWDLEGHAIKSSAKLGVVSIEPLGESMRLYDITTGTGDFIADGVVSHNCFARPTHKYLDFDAGRDFEREIVVKVNVPEVLRAELKRPSWKGEHVAMGTNTDPYQWVEGRYRLMPGIWEALRDFRNPCSVLTKSPLLLRDLPIMKEISAVTEISANLSIPTMEEKAWRASEPHTPNPRARMEAVAELNRNGIPTGILVAPLMPGINDDPRQVQAILDAAAEAGATSIGGIGLHLRGEVRGVFLEWLASYRPDLLEHYEQLYARGAYLPQAERDRLSGLLRAARPRRMGPFRRDPADARPADRSRRSPSGERPPRERDPSAAALQEQLF